MINVISYTGTLAHYNQTPKLHINVLGFYIVIFICCIILGITVYLKGPTQPPLSVPSVPHTSPPLSSNKRTCRELWVLNLSFQLFPGQELAEFSHKDYATCVQFHPSNHNLFMVGTFKSNIFCWDTRSAKVGETVP